MAIETEEALKKRLLAYFEDEQIVKENNEFLEHLRNKFSLFSDGKTDKSYNQLIDGFEKNSRIKDPYSTKNAFSKPNGYAHNPKAIDFYYLRIDTDSKIRVDHYPYIHRNGQGASTEIPKAQLKGIIASLAQNARSFGNIPPKGTYNNFKDIVWKYKCYIVIFLDEAGWEYLAYDQATKVSGLLFKKINSHSGNPCFYDAEVLQIPMPPASPIDERQALVFINHMKDDNGKDLKKGDAVEYKFDIVLRAPFANPSTEKLTIIVDPTGTNEGPPKDP